jgi:regulator of replication initiation timing
MVNVAQQHARWASEHERLTFEVSDLEIQMEAAIEGGDATQAEEDRLRTQLALIKAAMAQARNNESFYRQETEENKKARKDLGDLAKG